jgi:hypothetical protein
VPAAAAAYVEPAQAIPAAASLETAGSASTDGDKQAATAAGVTLAVAAAESLQRKGSSGWLPALLLAGEAYAGLGEHAQAVVHLAQVGVL